MSKAKAKSAANETMQVKVLEDRLHDADPENGQHYSLGKGDIITVSKATGQRWCDLGWVKDVAGAYATGERIPGARALEVQDGILAQEK